jgi:hypothetical protein
MAGFFKGLQNMMMGKPVFDGSAPDNNSASSTPNQSPIQQRSEKPLVTVDRVEYTERGDEMLLNIHIRNNSSENVMLHKLYMLGRQDNLGYQLQPGQSRELREVYRGKLLPDTNRRTIELDYKGFDGNLFRTVHRAEYQRESSGTFGIRDVTYEPPIRDI